MSLVTIHNILATAVSLFTLGIALLALYHFLKRDGLGSDFWGAVVIGEVVIVAQALVGGIMYVGGVRPGQTIHLLYGVVALLAWPATYAFSHDQEERRQSLIWL